MTAEPSTLETAQVPNTAAAPNGEYTHEHVQHLTNAAHIRHRPGMYIGDTSTSGLHHLVYELVYNSVDEAMAGFCKVIQVKVNVDGSLTVSDDGRGIPVDTHPETGKSTLEMVLTLVGTGATFDKRTYKTSAGLHGIGAKAVTALSDWVEAEVRRNGRVYHQEFERGLASSEIKDIGVAQAGRTGTAITFHPDPEIFHEATFNYDTLEARLRELAFLNKGLDIRLGDERSGKEEVFKYDGGLGQFVEYLNRNEDVLHKPIYMDRTVDDVRVELSMQYTVNDEERVRCYTNNAYNPVGGTHLSGFRAAITRCLNNYGVKENLFKNNFQPIGEDFREGLTAVVSVQIPDPQFESNNKLRLNNPEVEGIVTSIVNESLAKYLEETPKDAQRIMKKVILAGEAREAAAKAKRALKDRKSILNSGGLPGKLMDCTRDGDDSELFLVEGDSAGGSAESGRDRLYQAILPLRGKPLNVEKARMEKMMSNEEICCIISAVGVDIGDEGDLTRLRYGKIVILTDADVDGQHIRTLLLTFFYRQMPKLIAGGHVFVARPPLYKVTQKKQVRYVMTIEKMSEELMKRGLEGAKLIVEPAVAGAAAPSTYEGERLQKLLGVLDELDGKGLQILERRGIDLVKFLARVGPNGLPRFRVMLGGAEHWFYTSAEADAFHKQEQERLGRDVVVADETPGSAPRPNGHSSGNGEGPVPTISKQELHEVKAINTGLEKLREFGLGTAELVPPPRVAGREPPPRLFLTSGDNRRTLAELRGLAPEVRKFGEKGLTITRFKGLGEMDPEELWDTTLDPARRTLLQVHLEDAFKADEMFRTLMGEKVEPRREFIQKHALEVKDIDYHGA
jgi:DNA gyrase subunit B